MQLVETCAAKGADKCLSSFDSGEKMRVLLNEGMLLDCHFWTSTDVQLYVNDIIPIV